MRVLLCCFLVYFSQTVLSQSVPKLLEIADELYQANQYLEAIEFYEKITGIDKNNLFARFRLGNSYLEALQFENAKKVFVALGNMEGHGFRAKSLYHYANLLRYDQKFNEADSIFSFLISLPDVEPNLVKLSQKQREGCLLAIRQQEVDKGFRVDLLELNSKFHDFGAVVNTANQKLVFVTTRKIRSAQYEGSQYAGLLSDLMAFEQNKNKKWKDVSGENNFSHLNTQWAEGSGSFTKDGKSFYFTSCHSQDSTNCKIMVSYLEKDKWSDPVQLNEYINEKGSENKQPHISPTGDTLFFSSNRPGSYGGTDIWMSLKGLEPESWTPAINMGEIINSPEDEITPYYSSAMGCLLFASNGHIGYGGYDIYAAVGKSFFEPDIYNLGLPFNSTRDDLYFNISDSIGFLSSNRADGKILNLYHFEVPNEQLFLSLLISGESLIDARIISRFRSIRSLDLVTFRVEDYQGYELFDPVLNKKPKRKPEEELDEDSLRENVQIAYEPIYFDYELSLIRPDAKAALDNLIRQLDGKSYEKINIMGFADNLGSESYNLNLSKKRGEAVKNYLSSNGIQESKLNVYPRGELSPRDNRDHWFGRILRRRVEITINANEPITLNTAKTLIVRKENTLKGIAKQLNINLKELQEWNGNPGQKINAGQTIRIAGPLIKNPDVRYLINETDIKKLFLTTNGF